MQELGITEVPQEVQEDSDSGRGEIQSNVQDMMSKVPEASNKEKPILPKPKNGKAMPSYVCILACELSPGWTAKVNDSPRKLSHPQSGMLLYCQFCRIQTQNM